MRTIFLFLFLLAVISCSRTQASKPHENSTAPLANASKPSEDSTMPSFDLLLSDSTTHINTKDIPTGKPVVLFYFGAYCSYSRAQMEDLIKNMDSLKDIQFYVFTRPPYQDMVTFKKLYHLEQFHNLTLGLDYKQTFQRYYKLVGYPSIAVYDGDKKLKQLYVGTIPFKEIRYRAIN